MRINTANTCTNCIHGSVDDSDKRKVMIRCKLHNKPIYFGRIIDCEDTEKKNK